MLRGAPGAGGTLRAATRGGGLTEAEWNAIGEAGAAGFPKSTLPLVFGMFAYEGDPAVLRGMLKAAPALPRVVIPRIAPRFYARRALPVHGTRRP